MSYMNFLILLFVVVGVQAKCTVVSEPGPGCEGCSYNGSSSYCYSCHIGYYQERYGISEICIKCPEECSHCDSLSVEEGLCRACSDGYYTTGSALNDRCLKCDDKCKTCEGAATDCTSCGIGYYDDMTGSGGLANCVSCEGNCGECTKPSDTIVCSGCKPEFFGPPSCTSKCDDSCLTCSGAEKTNCKSCKPGRFLTETTVAGGVCKICSESFPNCAICDEVCEKCKEGYYLEKGLCKKCTQDDEDGEGIKNCLACGQTEGCLECKSGYYRYDSENCKAKEDIDHCKTFTAESGCIECDPGYYTTTPITCQKCPWPCAECNTDEDYPGTYVCTGCEEDYYLHVYPEDSLCQKCASKEGNDHCATCEDDGKCLACEENYFLDEGTGCAGCYGLCTTCEGTAKNKCLTCYEGYYISKTSSSATGECLECDISCKTCNKAGEAGCTSCRKTAYLDKSSGKCYSCTTISNCQECSSSSTCTKCKKGYYLKNGKCEGCPESTALAKCAQCTSATECETCNNGYYADLEGSCKQCAPGCKKCKNKALCIECLYGDIDGDGECQETKPDGSPITEDDYIVDDEGNYIGESFSAYIFSGLALIISLLMFA